MSFDAFSTKLADLEIFRGLQPAQLTAIARSAERMVFRPGQSIIASDEAGDGAYVLMGGEASMLAGEAGPGEAAVAAGTLLGEMAMLIEHDYRVTVVARGSVKALKITRAALHQLMLRDPTLAEHFVARISSRLSRVAVQLRRIDETLALAAEMSHAPA